MAKVRVPPVERLRSFVRDYYERADSNQENFVQDLGRGMPSWFRWEGLVESLQTLSVLRGYAPLEGLEEMSEEKLRKALEECASFCERDVLHVAKGLMTNGEANSTSGTVRYMTAMQVQARADLAARIRERLR